MTDCIEVHQLKKTFKNGNQDVCVLHGIDCLIEEGKMTMLVGPSGCGKTTFISILSGMLRQTEGDVFLGGTSLKNMKEDAKALFRRRFIGFVFQQYSLLPFLNSAENISLPLLAEGCHEKEALTKACCLLKEMEMELYQDHFPSQLSGGQQQRVAIARALVHNPKWIICDEPTAALDGKTGLSIMEILRKIVDQQKKTVLVVSHDTRIFHLADRILQMQDGMIIGDFSYEEFIKKELKN